MKEEIITPSVVDDMPNIDLELTVAEPMQGNQIADSIALPGFDDFGEEEAAEKKVVLNIRNVFKGFDFNSKDDFAGRFDTVESLAEYAKNARDDIRDASTKSIASSLLTKAACIGRFWCVGKTLDEALQNASYGTKTNEQLANHLGTSLGYIYKWRSVAKKISLSKAYLLGVRGVEQTTLVNLAYNISDDEQRDCLINGFIGAVVDGADDTTRLTALKALKDAIKDLQHNNQNALEISTSDPVALDPELDTTPEVAAMKKMLKSMKKTYAKVSDEALFDSFTAACDNFFITDKEPDCDEQLDNIKAEAEELKKKLTAAVNMTRDAITQLDSILMSRVLKDDAP